MPVQEKISLDINLLEGLSEDSLAKVTGIGTEYLYRAGETCQCERETPRYVEIILEGSVGVEVNIPTVYHENKIILQRFGPGVAFGLSALTHQEAWSKLRALETTRVLRLEAKRLRELCETDKEIGYAVMKNLANIIVSRLKRERVLMLRALTEIKVFNL